MSSKPKKGIKDYAKGAAILVWDHRLWFLGAVAFFWFLWNSLDRDSIFAAAFAVALVGLVLFSQKEETHPKQVQLGITLLGGAVVGLVVATATIQVDLLSLRQNDAFERLESMESLSVLERRVRKVEDRLQEARATVGAALECKSALRNQAKDEARIPRVCRRFVRGPSRR